MGADLVFAVGACRSDSRDPLRSADSHVPPGQSFVRVDFSFEREFLFFFGEFKNSVINGIKISENENVLKVNKMELNEIIGLVIISAGLSPSYVMPWYGSSVRRASFKRSWFGATLLA